MLTSAVTTVLLTAATLHSCSPRLDMSTILRDETRLHKGLHCTALVLRQHHGVLYHSLTQTPTGRACVSQTLFHLSRFPHPCQERYETHANTGKKKKSTTSVHSIVSPSTPILTSGGFAQPSCLFRILPLFPWVLVGRRAACARFRCIASFFFLPLFFFPCQSDIIKWPMCCYSTGGLARV